MDAALALAGPTRPRHSPSPARPAETDDVIWWIVVVGFAYAVALAWATWCRHNGGSAEISFGWTGFKVVCRSSLARTSPATGGEGGAAALPRTSDAARWSPRGLEAVRRRRRARGGRPRASVQARSSALVGPNGSGKTTLLRAVAGLVALDAGSILVADPLPARRRPRRNRSRPGRADRVRRADGPRARPSSTRSGRRTSGRGPRQILISAAFGLDERLDHRLGTLSRGLRRQASVVAAFSLAPPLVLVDEATATLDPEAVVVLGEAVAALAATGCGVLLATQDLHFAGEVVPRGRAAPSRRGHRPGRARRAAVRVTRPVPRGRLPRCSWRRAAARAVRDAFDAL